MPAFRENRPVKTPEWHLGAKVLVPGIEKAALLLAESSSKSSSPLSNQYPPIQLPRPPERRESPRQ